MNSNKVSVALVFSIISVLFGILYVQNLNTEKQLTEFYLLGADRSAEGYPLNLEKGETGRVIVGVLNREFDNAEYRVAVVHRSEILGERRIILRNEERWEESFTFKLNEEGRQKLEFLLYRDEKPYRRLHLWTNVS